MVFSNISKFLFILLFSTLSFGQNVGYKKMKDLNFLVGDLVGTSTSYKDGIKTGEVSATETIKYGLDGNILIIDLKSETLQLHTVIYYDEKEETYFYNPFYKTGAAKYKAEFIDGKFIVNPSDTKRFIFTLDEAGNFTEYGEILVNGEWTIYFKDIFKKAS